MKDSNAQSYFQWCNAADFAPDTSALRWNGAIHALQLGSILARPPESVPPATARAAAAAAPLAVDPFDTWARVSPARTAIAVGGVTAPALPLFDADPGETIADLAHTADGWLLVALRSGSEGRLVVRDLSDRFDEITLAEPGFAPDRVAVSSRIWLVDRARRALRCLEGRPLPRRIERRRRDPADFQGRPLNPDPLRLRQPPVDTAALTEEILDAEADAAGRLILLVAGPERGAGVVVVDTERAAPPRFVEGLQSAFSLARLGPDKLAYLVPGASFAVASALPGDAPLTLLGDRLPLKGWSGGRFCKSTDHVARYPVATADPQDLRPFRRLIALSKPEYARAGRARASILDGGVQGMTWHRLYAEAQIPPECGFTAFLAAADDPGTLATLPQPALHPHAFGRGPADPGTPRAVWLDMDSELPFRPSATGCACKPDRCGLYSVLVQTPPGDAPVRRLRGRYLRVELAFTGSGRATPRLHALRVWGARNAWRDRYLPDYLSVEAGHDAAGSDFLDRFLALFESYLTPLEDQVAQSWRLTNPATAPADALEWLAGWLGAPLDSGLDLPAKRRFLAEAMSVWRSRGTLLGLHKVLDIVTGGGVARGELVVLEHYLMRRTFSTILGADLSDAANPLTPFAASSGNSHLGPTFFLGEADQRAFLALFRPSLLTDPLTSAAERLPAQAEIATLFDAAAHRASVIARSSTDAATLGLIARAVEREAPAHVAVDIRRAPASLVLGLASLVAVETRLGPRPPDPPCALDAARLGQAFLSDAPSLDPRLEGGA